MQRNNLARRKVGVSLTNGAQAALGAEDGLLTTIIRAVRRLGATRCTQDGSSTEGRGGIAPPHGTRVLALRSAGKLPIINRCVKSPK